MISLTIEANSDEIKKALKKWPRLAHKEYTTAIKRSTTLLQREGRSQAPFRTGNLRHSIRKRTGRKLEGVVYVSRQARYGIFVHEGTSTITPNRFFTRTVQRRKRQVLGEFKKATDKIVKQVARSSKSRGF